MENHATGGKGGEQQVGFVAIENAGGAVHALGGKMGDTIKRTEAPIVQLTAIRSNPDQTLVRAFETVITSVLAATASESEKIAAENILRRLLETEAVVAALGPTAKHFLVKYFRSAST